MLACDVVCRLLGSSASFAVLYPSVMVMIFICLKTESRGEIKKNTVGNDYRNFPDYGRCQVAATVAKEGTTWSIAAD